MHRRRYLLTLGIASAPFWRQLKRFLRSSLVKPCEKSVYSCQCPRLSLPRVRIVQYPFVSFRFQCPFRFVCPFRCVRRCARLEVSVARPVHRCAPLTTAIVSSPHSSRCRARLPLQCLPLGPRPCPSLDRPAFYSLCVLSSCGPVTGTVSSV